MAGQRPREEAFLFKAKKKKRKKKHRPKERVARVSCFLAHLLRLRLSLDTRNALSRMPSYYYADQRACSRIFRAGPLSRAGWKAADQVNIANRCTAAIVDSISRANWPTERLSLSLSLTLSGSRGRRSQLISNFPFLSAFDLSNVANQRCCDSSTRNSRGFTTTCHAF